MFVATVTKPNRPVELGDRDVFTHELVNNDSERARKEEVVVCRHSYRQGELATAI